MKKLLSICVVIFFAMPARADEGMWLLPYLEQNAKEMKAAGLKLKVKDIYNSEGTSLKDAVVIFGGGCTGEVVSPEGLVLTNHHCGYGSIQQLSSVESDFLKNGFWAMSRDEEIPAPGLSVSFIRQIKDVTGEIVAPEGAARDSLVRNNLRTATQKYMENFPDLKVQIVPFMGGNQYFLVVKEIFTDIRLVGTPPNSMGKFGGDTDNWMWPRHTDDFSMWRIYASADNKPADYSPDNKPYEAPQHLKISLKGVEKNDFAMVMGFPGSTDRYMTTYEMRQMVDVENADRIYIRGERQKILMEDMLADDAVMLQYAAKYASSANYWKNAMGMNAAIAKNGIIAQKQALENRFGQWADGQTGEERYSEALENIKTAVEAQSEADGVYGYLIEAFIISVEIQKMSLSENLLNAITAGNKAEVLEKAASFYKDFNEPTDRRVAKRMIAIVRENIPVEYLPSFYGEIDSLYGGNIDAFVDNMYDTSIVSSKEKFEAALENIDTEAWKNDPVKKFKESVVAAILAASFKAKQATDIDIADRRRIYMKGLTEMDRGTKFYPDANFTIRLTYGNVLPYEPRDGVIYKYYTTLVGVVAKEDPSNALEFTVDQKIKDAYASGDYGRYGYNGELRVNFLTNNDITGGNSGSPVLNARGELIGLAFDGNWEALSSDVMFDARLQRCINVDIRYVMWTIDRYAGAGYLLDEMTIVK